MFLHALVVETVQLCIIPNPWSVVSQFIYKLMSYNVWLVGKQLLIENVYVFTILMVIELVK